MLLYLIYLHKISKLRITEVKRKLKTLILCRKGGRNDPRRDQIENLIDNDNYLK